MKLTKFATALLIAGMGVSFAVSANCRLIYFSKQQMDEIFI